MLLVKEHYDQYFTNAAMFELLYGLIDPNMIIYEPFFGDGYSGDTFRKMGFKVIHEPIDSHLGDCIISNPPFADASKMLKTLIDIDKPFILLMPKEKKVRVLQTTIPVS